MAHQSTEAASSATEPRSAALASGACLILNNSDAGSGCVLSGIPAFLSPLPLGAIPIDRVANRLRRMRSAVMTYANQVDAWTKTISTRYGWRAFMVTLTYADSGSWAPDHLSRMLDALGAWWRRRCSATASRGAQNLRSLPYAWTMELQQRGAPHYHIVIWVPRGVFLPHPDSRGWWPHGCSNVEPVRANAAAYIAKYASKLGEQVIQNLALPFGARIHGQGGLPRKSIHARICRWWRLPHWLKERFPLANLSLTTGLVRRYIGRRTGRVRQGRVLDHIEWTNERIRGPGGAFLSWVSESGELLESPWRVGRDPISGVYHCWRISC